MHSKIIDYLSELFSQNSVILRNGEMPFDLFEEIQKFAMLQVECNFDDATRNSYIGFCFPHPPIRYPKTEAEAIEYWESGATLSIQSLEERSVFFKSICNGLGKLLGNEVTVSMYVSKPNGISFSSHYDEWEGLALQIYGIKKFTIRENKNEMTYLIEPKHWLRLDPIDLHFADTNSFSVHLNFAVHRKFAYKLKP